MLQQPQAEDFVLATGETHPVREFVEKSFGLLGMDIKYVNIVLHVLPHVLMLPLSGGEALVSTRRVSTRRRARLSSKLTRGTSDLLKSSAYDLPSSRSKVSYASMVSGCSSGIQPKPNVSWVGSARSTSSLS